MALSLNRDDGLNIDYIFSVVSLVSLCHMATTQVVSSWVEEYQQKLKV